MNKRDFIKAGILGTAGMLSLPARAGGLSHTSEIKLFDLPELPYSYNALEPYFSAKCIQKQHSALHAEYTTALNKALLNSGIRINNVRNLHENISGYNRSIQFNAGGYLNQKMFWKYLSPAGGGDPLGKLAEEMKLQFGSIASFKRLFADTANANFGAGWAWLVSRGGKLRVTSTSNHDSPYMDIIPGEEQGFPVLCLNLWDHAYKEQYGSRENEYIDAFWHVVNWNQVARRFAKSLVQP